MRRVLVWIAIGCAGLTLLLVAAPGYLAVVAFTPARQATTGTTPTPARP